MHWTHWAESADQNKDPITAAIAPLLREASAVLELGSGTGQHAVHLAGLHPQLRWQPTEHPQMLDALAENLRQHPLPNLAAPLALDASAERWPRFEADLLYSSNTLHIMSWDSVCRLFGHVGEQLGAGHSALFYGPFRFADRPFAPSNTAFDAWLKERDPLSGVRDVEALQAQADAAGLSLEAVIDMPANNHILHWRRDAS